MNDEYVLEVWGYDINPNTKDQCIIDTVCKRTGADVNAMRQLMYREGKTWAGFKLVMPKEIADELKDIIQKMGYSACVRREGQLPSYFVDIRGYDVFGDTCRWYENYDTAKKITDEHRKLMNVVGNFIGKEINLPDDSGLLRIELSYMGEALELKRRIKELSDKYIITIHTSYVEFDYSNLKQNGTKMEINSPEEMKDYLRDVYTLEKELYCAKEGKKKISDTIKWVGTKSRPLREEPDITSEGLVFWVLFVGCILPAIFVGALIGSYIKAFIGAVILCALASAGVHVSNSREVKKVMKKYNAELQKMEEQREAIIPKLPEYEETENDLDNTLESCQEALNELYGYDIIFPKYRNFVAISQIYEYFASGRVTELGGPNGAYNLFESELRQNIIICELNTIIRQLDDIRHYQRMTYNAITESNRLLANIEQNTAVSAFNSSVIAENTNIMRRYADVAIHNN